MKSIVDTLLLLIAMVLSPVATGQDDSPKFPFKYITLIVSSGAGGNTDLGMRQIAKLAEPYLGQPIVIRNEPGKFLAINNLLRASPDGHTLAAISMTQLVYGPHLEKVPYNIKQDFTYLAQAFEYNLFLAVRADSPWKSLQDFVKDGRSRSLTYSTTGYKGPYQILMVEVARREKANFVFVPYRTANEILPAVLGGHTDAGYTGVGVKELVRKGQLRILVTDSTHRMASAPDVPTFIELGYPRHSTRFAGIVGPKGMPQRVSAKLEEAFRVSLTDPSLSDFLGKMDLARNYLDGKKFQEAVFTDHDGMAKTLRELAPLLGD